MQHITLACVGGLRQRFYADAAAEYQKRLGALCRFAVKEVAAEALNENKAGGALIAAALQKEATRLTAALPKNAKVAALCVEGKQLSSEEFAALLGRWANEGAAAAFVIGSSHGLEEGLKQRADIRLSLSAMTLPHELARLVLTEQIYRGLMIGAGRRYHK